jgi:DNA-binding transcriptional MerR regulator
MSLAMDRVGYTVSELADRVGAKSPQQRDLWLRRLRHWTTMGVLAPVGDQHTGTGHARRYGEDALYTAAVLLRLGDLGLPIGSIKAVARYIGDHRVRDQEFEGLWQDAKNPRPDATKTPVFLAVMTGRGVITGGDVTSVGIDRGPGSLLTPNYYLEGETVIVRNLTVDFAQVTPV